MLSNNLCDDVIEYYNIVESKIIYMSASPNFPPRKQLRNIPDDLTDKIITEIYKNLSDYYTKLSIKDNIRIYCSDYGTIKPHVDIPMCGDDTHTCLIYLTDNFVGGNLTIENKISDLKTENITIKPKKSFGIIFPKGYVHYTDELQSGKKLILLIDLKILL